MTASYLDLHSVAHVHDDLVGAVGHRMDSRYGQWQSLYNALRPAEVHVAGRCNDEDISCVGIGRQ